MTPALQKRIHKNSSRAQSLINPRNAFPAAQLQNIAVCGVFYAVQIVPYCETAAIGV